MCNFGVLGALVWHALSHALSRTGGSSSASSWHDTRPRVAGTTRNRRDRLRSNRRRLGCPPPPAAAGNLSGRCPRVKFSLEKVRLILAVEGDLKPNPTVSLGNRPERDWLDFPVIQPGSDLAHNTAEGTFRLFFDAHDEWWIERHIALLWPVRRELMGLSVGAASLAGRTNNVRYRAIRRIANRFPRITCYTFKLTHYRSAEPRTALPAYTASSAVFPCQKSMTYSLSQRAFAAAIHERNRNFVVLATRMADRSLDTIGISGTPRFSYRVG